jgi:rhomboid protease GluP
LHLGSNLVGLWILGRYLERVAGRALLSVAYVAATIGGNALGAIALGLLSQGPRAALGASGGVMGLLGAGMGLAAIEAWRTRSPLARRQVGSFATVLGLQTAFDLTTPQVSFAIHASGFCVGLLVGAAWTLLRPARGPSVAR